MRFLRRMISGLLALCMVVSVIPPVFATENSSSEKRILLDEAAFLNQATVWVDGIERTVYESNGSRYVELPAETNPSNMVTYSYHTGDASDVHTQYPIGMEVWALKKNADGSYTPAKVEKLKNILQYSGSSIRITGKKGIRMITSIDQNKKKDLTSSGLDGYKLLEYGTVLAWSSDLAGGKPLILGANYAKSNYAYKKGVADPVFAYDGNLMQYTNVLVGFSLDECKDDIAMRPYMILEGSGGKQMTVYGGIVHRSIGYIAWQNRDVFTPGSAAYNYVWEIINYVYGDSFAVSFDSNGGSAIEAQSVKHGTTAAFPGIPTRTGYAFAGWYLDKNETDLKNQYDFSTPITGDLVLYAKWIDIETDSDKDGLADEMEAIFGTNPKKADTDDDGLTDYQECIDLGTDPTLVDSDKDGVSDFDEDADNDSLSNGKEYELGTNPFIPDMDYDDLSDGEEINIHKTNPSKPDTDDDGADDSWEIENGFDPSVYNNSFNATAEADAVNVSASVTASIAGKKVASLKVTPVVDHPILNKRMPGYIDVPFEFTVDDNLQGAAATIQFSIKNGVQRSADFNPTIYYYNESTQELEELDTTVSGNVASAVVAHFSTYILLNKTAFDKVWETEIKPPIDSGDGISASIDVAFVIDASGSMSSYNRLSTAKAALHTFIGALSEKDRAALIRFNTSATVLSNLTADKASVDSKVDSVYASGNTSMYTGFREALSMLSNANETYGYKMIIILSDGSDVPSTSYSKYYASLVQQAVDNNIVVFTIGAGTSVDTSILTQIATNTGGSYYTATVTSGILDAFDQIQEETVDLVTDTDKDGLPDYYEQNLTNSAGVPLNLDINDPDCDGDGLLDGEEVEIVVTDEGKVYSLMKTDPWMHSTDMDAYSDYDEYYTYNSDPLIKNVAFLNKHTNFIIDNENFVSDKYLDCYENKWIGWMERGGVWIGNRVFAANYDDVYLYKVVLMKYLEDMTAASEVATQIRDRIGFIQKIIATMNGNIGDARELLEVGAEEAKQLKELQEKLHDYQKMLDDFPYEKLNDMGYSADFLNNITDDILEDYLKVSDEIPELKATVEFNTSVSKAGDVVGIAMNVVDVVLEGYDVYVEYLQFSSKISEMECCLDSLDLIIRSGDAPDKLKSAAKELYNAIEAEKVDSMDMLRDVLIQTGGKITNEIAWGVLVKIPVIGKYLLAVKIVLSIADFAFNMGDVAEQCACLYAISKSATILAKRFNNTMEKGDGQRSWTIIYNNYVDAADEYLSLNTMRKTAENQMKKADEANSFLIEWLFTEFMYKLDDIDANVERLDEIRSLYMVPSAY